MQEVKRIPKPIFIMGLLSSGSMMFIIVLFGIIIYAAFQILANMVTFIFGYYFFDHHKELFINIRKIPWWPFKGIFRPLPGIFLVIGATLGYKFVAF